MREITCEIEIDAPPETVFAFLTNFEAYPEFDPGIEKVVITSPNQTGVGVKTHWTATRDGKTREWDEEVVGWRDNEYYAYRVGNREFPASHTITKTDSGSKLTYVNRFSEDPKMSMDIVQKRMQTLLDHVKEHLER
jgi:carbon monoxide dehydrogenase subunit G